MVDNILPGEPYSNPQGDMNMPLGAGILGPDGGINVGQEISEMDKIFKQMLDPENIFHFTELSAAEITAFSTLGTIVEKRMKNGVVHKWLLKNLQMRVSKQRKGKAEFVKISARNPYMEQPPQSQRGFGSIFRR